MNNYQLIDRIISKERLEPYITHHRGNIENALFHYKSNILICESFYPLLAVIEVGLRNAIDFQLSKSFNDRYWFENDEFIQIANKFQIDRIADAKKKILSEKRELTPGIIISELSFGFWTSLFDVHFELTLWKRLRLTFPNCPKESRQRKTMSSKFNSIRKLRNRIFHHESISWNLYVLNCYKQEIMEGIEWLDKDLIHWIDELNHVDFTINQYKKALVTKSLN
jgi:hypothetical protein